MELEVIFAPHLQCDWTWYLKLPAGARQYSIHFKMLAKLIVSVLTLGTRREKISMLIVTSERKKGIRSVRFPPSSLGT